jgi:hypothetical protein
MFCPISTNFDTDVHKKKMYPVIVGFVKIGALKTMLHLGA